VKGYIICDGKAGYRFFPKTACTSIKHALFELEENKKFSPKENGMYLHDYINKKCLSVIDDCERRFVVIRDPIKRFLSAYGNRVTHHGELSEEYIREKSGEHYDKIPHFNPSLHQYIDGLDAYLNVGSIKHHVKPISCFVDYESLDYFTDIYRIEDIDRFESDLSEMYGKPVLFEHRQVGGNKFALNDLTKKQVKKLLDYYREDYLLLAEYYSEDLILDEWLRLTSIG